MSLIPLGIDLGTTYSAISKWENIHNHIGPKLYYFDQENNYFLPSKVYYEDNAKYIVGTAAIRKGKLKPDCFFSAFKRGMDSNTPLPLGTQTVTPVELSSHIIYEALELAGNKENPTSFVPGGLVVSVPYYFKEPQNVHTIEAVKLALDRKFTGRHGYSENTFLRLIPEPIAAGLSYVAEHPNDIVNETILVFDLGGGTFDVTVFKVENDLSNRKISFKVLATDGDSRLGGEDFDNSLMQYIIETEGVNVDTVGDNDKQKKRYLLDLSLACTECKIQLSSSDSFEMIMPFFEGRTLERVVQRTEFEDCFCGKAGAKIDYLSKIFDKVDNVIELANVSKNQINRVVLIGGSSNIPLIKRTLQKRFGDKIYTGDTSGAVAMGASLVAAIELDRQNKKAGKPNEYMTLWDEFKIEEPTAHSIGILMANGRVDEIIKRNSITPASAIRIYHPTQISDDGKLVQISHLSIRQGDEEIGKVEMPKIFAHGRDAKDIKISVELIAESTEIRSIITVAEGNEDKSDLKIESHLNIRK